MMSSQTYNYFIHKQCINIMHCINCGKQNHTAKFCKEPRTSYGVILIEMCINDPNDINKDHFISTINYQIDINKISTCIRIDNDVALSKYGKYKDSVKFLLVQRKHTLGLLEFIRGNYDPYYSYSVVHLFKQMTPIEIDKIKNCQSFGDLWHSIYGTSTNYENLFNESKIKFNKLKAGTDVLKLDYYLNNIAPEFTTQEWGFPKGRREKYETDIECAFREFIEETSFKGNFQILNKIPPIEENIIGTNGIHYRHIYYVAITFNNESLGHNNSPEINDAKFFCIEDAIDSIRTYHHEKKNIIMRLYEHIINILINN